MKCQGGQKEQTKILPPGAQDPAKKENLKKNIANSSVYIMKQQSVHLFVPKKETFSKVYFKLSVEF